MGDRSAIRFSIGFYQALAGGRSVETAFDVAVAQLMMTPRGEDAQALCYCAVFMGRASAARARRNDTPGATYNLAGFDPAAPLKIGILATAAGASDPIPAHFAYVRVYRPQS